MRSKKLPKILYISYCICLIIVATNFSPPTWDEFLDFSGNVGAFNHALSFLSGHPSDITTITHDLEWYGNAYRWPSYLLWSILHEFPVKIPEGYNAYDKFLTGHYSAAIHIVAAAYSCIGIFFYWKILRHLNLPKNLAYVSTLILSTSPFWLSNSLWNVKDFPVAVASIILIYLSLVCLDRPNINLLRWFLACSLLLATILANKYAYFPLVAIYGFVLSISFEYRVLARCSNSPYLSTSCLRVSCTTAILAFSSFLISLPISPQFLGNINFPIESARYFLNHPLVLFDKHQSISFLASRISFLISPPTLVFILLTAGMLVKLLLKPKLFLLHLSIPKYVVLTLFLALPLFVYLFPILVTGRVLYGQDLRHLIWLYPAFILFLTVSADLLLRSVSTNSSKAIRTTLFALIIVHLVEIAAIFPHFYTYKGISPLSLPSDPPYERVLLSHYSRGIVPELHASLFRRCFLDSECKSILESRLSPTSIADSLAFVDKDISINPAYLEAYLRLGNLNQHGSSYDLLGYDFDFKEHEDCLSMRYGRKLPIAISASSMLCGLHE